MSHVVRQARGVGSMYTAYTAQPQLSRGSPFIALTMRGTEKVGVSLAIWGTYPGKAPPHTHTHHTRKAEQVLVTKKTLLA